MALILSISDLKEYKAQIERQKEVLKLSPVFNEEQKKEVATIYESLIDFCNDRLSKELEVSNPVTL